MASATKVCYNSWTAVFLPPFSTVWITLRLTSTSDLVRWSLRKLSSHNDHDDGTLSTHFNCLQIYSILVCCFDAYFGNFTQTFRLKFFCLFVPAAKLHKRLRGISMSLSLTYLRRSRGWHVLFTPRKRFCFLSLRETSQFRKIYICLCVGGVGSERSGAGMNERSLVGRAQLQLTFTRKYVQLENFAREVWQEFALTKVFFSPRKKKSCMLNLTPLCCVSKSVTSVFMFSFRLMFRDTFLRVSHARRPFFYSNAAVMTHTQ